MPGRESIRVMSRSKPTVNDAKFIKLQSVRPGGRYGAAGQAPVSHTPPRRTGPTSAAAVQPVGRARTVPDRIAWKGDDHHTRRPVARAAGPRARRPAVAAPGPD